MDIGSIGQSAPVQNVPIVSPKSSESAAPVPAAPQGTSVPRPQPVTRVEIRASDEQRMAAIREALARSVQETFAVSDQSFSLFKDASGQIITRFTSLRDGSVRYVPEPDIMKHLANKGYDPSTIKVSA